MRFALLTLAGLLGTAHAVDLPDDIEPCPVKGEVEDDSVYLITVGPGVAPYSYIGHSALWVRAPSRKMNHTIEYGAFDSSKQEPFTNLMRGTLSCRWKVVFSYKSQARYENEGRHAVAQKLQLPPEQNQFLITQLRDIALNTKDTWAPFHWRFNSCASEARDWVDAATGNSWSHALKSTEAPMTPREEVLRHVGLHPWAWFGLHALSGSRVDQPQSVWDSGFVPERIYQGIEDYSYPWPDGSSRPLLGDTCLMNAGTEPWPLEEPPKWAPYTLLLGALWGGLLLALGRKASASGARRRSRWSFGLGVAFLGAFVGTFGVVSMTLAAVAVLEAYRDNAGWLFMNPLALGLVPAGFAWARGKRPGWARGLTLLLGLGVLLTPVGMAVLGQSWLPPWSLLGLPLLALAALQLKPSPES